VFAAVPDPSPGGGPRCGNDGDPEIYTMAPDGSRLRRLTDNQGHETTPAWSPDHTHIVFAAQRPLNRDFDVDRDLFVMKADGTEVRRLTNGPGQDWAPAWSPEGDRIAFVRHFPLRRGVSSSDDKHALMLLRLDGSTARRLTRPHSWAGDLAPAWSPEGSGIAYSRDRYPGPVSQLVVAAPGERGRTVVQDRRKLLSLPDWSPDGRWLLYTTFRSETQLERVSADGSRHRVVLSRDWAAEPDSPAWSPRGDRIAYMGTMKGCLPHVYRMRADGGGPRDLLRGRDLDVDSLDW
jgi:TolB protein